MKILLVTAPMTQLNTPYPAVAYLSAFLRKKGFEVAVADFAIELALRIFSQDGLKRVSRVIQRLPKKLRQEPILAQFLDQQALYQDRVEPVVRFLQGKNPSLAYRITRGDFLPLGRRLRSVDTETLVWGFGNQSVQDLARHLASLFLDEIVDVIREGVDPRFSLAKYGEKLAESAPSFGPLENALLGEPTLIDELLDELTQECLMREKPALLCISAPFSGNAYGAFRVAQTAKKILPPLVTVLGGGYVNTELRNLTEPRVFSYFDFVTLDDGEAPCLAIAEGLREKTKAPSLIRTYRRNGETQRVEFVPGTPGCDFKQADLPAPSYQGLRLDQYLSFVEVLNPMHRLWSEGHWNKLTLAHGCYWKKCAFCDVTLDYISRYEAVSAKTVVDRMEALLAETGVSGFHFVDEAAPPALLKAVAEEILRRKLTVSWWGNVRFEKSFTPALVKLLARSGCIAVSGGLEVASDRLLKLMQKGVSVEQVSRVTRSLVEAGILVHAYLIYGFPSETLQETVDSLEVVRQLFKAGCLHSAFWHRFSATVHSPIGLNPERFGIRITGGLPQNVPGFFAANDLHFVDSEGCSAEELEISGRALERAVYNYMHGAGMDLDVRSWFEIKAPTAKVKKNTIQQFLR